MSNETSQPVVAVLGASSQRRKFGNKSVRAHAHAGWTVIPVHPRETEIEGLQVVPRLADLPKKDDGSPIDRISVYLPPAVTLGLLEEMADVGASEIWLNPGAGSREIMDRGKAMGLPLIDGCSIVDLGLSPSQFPD